MKGSSTCYKRNERLNHDQVLLCTYPTEITAGYSLCPDGDGDAQRGTQGIGGVIWLQELKEKLQVLPPNNPPIPFKRNSF